MQRFLHQCQLVVRGSLKVLLQIFWERNIIEICLTRYFKKYFFNIILIGFISVYDNLTSVQWTSDLRSGGQGHTLPTSSSLTHTNNHNCSIINACFHTFWLDHHGLMDRQINGWTDRTDKASVRVACRQQEMIKMMNEHKLGVKIWSETCILSYLFAQS